MSDSVCVRVRVSHAVVSDSVCVRVRVSDAVVSDSWQLHGLWPVGLLCPWNSPGKNTGVGFHALLQGSS